MRRKEGGQGGGEVREAKVVMDFKVDREFRVDRQSKVV